MPVRHVSALSLKEIVAVRVVLLLLSPRNELAEGHGVTGTEQSLCTTCHTNISNMYVYTIVTRRSHVPYQVVP